jgi:deoxyguanosine kinase
MKALPARLRHVVVEGPIGVGKTSLARRLAALDNAQLQLEQPATNPFLERYYRDRARWALATQMFFLFQRVEQMRELTQGDLFRGRVISDFLFDKDALFARLTLADDEFKLYEALFAHLAPQAPAPDLVIYLQARPETLLARIAARGIGFELGGIREPYLRALVDAYARFFHGYDAAPLLLVNAEHLNPVDRDQDFELLLEQIAHMRGTREYFSRAD